MTQTEMINFCHACASSAPTHDAASKLHCVTSDCRPWDAQAEFAVCTSCGLIQKRITSDWSHETKNIYASYSMYPQGDGAEQTTFQNETGVAQARSMRIVECLASQGMLPETGNMLDIGCGNGNMIRSFHRSFSKWALAGQEWDTRHAEIVQAIPNVTHFFTDFPDDHAEKFNLISMIHVLEHIVDPINYLRKLASLLSKDGMLLIQVPNLRQNPYDLAIFDHCSHFTQTSLKAVLSQAHFQIEWLSEDVISKELTILCRPDSSGCTNAMVEDRDLLDNSYAWLERFIQRVETVKDQSPLGIFGTSIGSSWVVSEIGHAPTFFLDEDSNRIGKRHLDRPILAPADTPQGASIIVPLAPVSAAAVSTRIARSDLKVISPL